MREFPEERLITERLWEAFQKDWLSIKEVARFDGCSERTAKRRYQISSTGIGIGSLAHKKCELSRK